MKKDTVKKNAKSIEAAKAKHEEKKKKIEKQLSNVNSTKLSLSENIVLLVYTTHVWGNRKTADKSKIQTKADKGFIHITKKLIKSDELRQVYNYFSEVNDWLKVRSVPSFVFRGAQLFSTDSVDGVEKYLKEAQDILKEKVERFMTAYKEKLEDSEVKLGDQFNRADYPSENELRRRFFFEWKWVRFDIPDNLPKKIFEAEKEKAEIYWKESVEKISQALRQSFIELIQHASKVLEPNENGKQKGWKTSSFDNVKEFISTFSNRNVVNDLELQKLVEKANEVLSRVEDPQELKRDEEMRRIVQKNFKEISKNLEKMIEVKPTRKFDLDE